VVLGVGQHVHQEEQQAFVGTERLENGDNLLRVVLGNVGDGDLGTKLSVLAVGAHQLIETNDEFVLLDTAEELQHDFLRDGVRVQHHSLAVVDANVVLKGAAI